MTCVKTGCHIYIIPHGMYAYGDAHLVNDVYFFRLAIASFYPHADVIHYEVNNYDSWWDKESTKNFRPPTSTLIAAGEDILSYGYDGRPLSEFPYANKGA
jgi:hypothetical protein